MYFMDTFGLPEGPLHLMVQGLVPGLARVLEPIDFIDTFGLPDGPLHLMVQGSVPAARTTP